MDTQVRAALGISNTRPVAPGRARPAAALLTSEQEDEDQRTGTRRKPRYSQRSRDAGRDCLAPEPPSLGPRLSELLLFSYTFSILNRPKSKIYFNVDAPLLSES